MFPGCGGPRVRRARGGGRIPGEALGAGLAAPLANRERWMGAADASRSVPAVTRREPGRCPGRKGATPSASLAEAFGGDTSDSPSLLMCPGPADWRLEPEPRRDRPCLRPPRFFLATNLSSFAVCKRTRVGDRNF